MKGERMYDVSVRAIAIVFVVVGLTILVLTLAHGGGPLSTGFLIGAAFIGLGVARYRLQSKIGKGG